MRRAPARLSLTLTGAAIRCRMALSRLFGSICSDPEPR